MKTKKLFFAFLAILLPALFYAQQEPAFFYGALDPYEQDIFLNTDLAHQGVDTVITFCQGSHSADAVYHDHCVCRGTKADRYTIWVQNGAWYIKRFNCCAVYSAVKVKPQKSWRLLINKLEALLIEKYRMDGLVVSDFYQLNLRAGNKEMSSYLDFSMLNRRLNPEHWRYNKNLRITQYILQMQKDLAKLNRKIEWEAE